LCTIVFLLDGTIDDGGHIIILKTSHRPTRHSRENKVDVIEQEEKSLKQNHCVEFASAFDFNIKADKETRISNIRKLYDVYGRENIHTITDNDFKGSLDKYTIDIHYKAKLTCSTEMELAGE